MIHSNCGGKLIVVDSTKHQRDSGLIVFRVRRCQKCKALIRSTESIQGAKLQTGYRHNIAYKEKVDDTDRAD